MRRLSSSAGRVIVSRASGAPELLNLDYRAHFQHISRRRHMQVRGEFSHMGCPWGWVPHAGWGPHHTFFREGSGFGQPRSAASYKE